MENSIRVKCVKEGNKLRIRIIDPGYNSFANCQFPRDIRVEGAEYMVPRENVSFSENAQKKFFYRIKKGGIMMLDAQTIEQLGTVVARVFENEDVDCIICYAEPKSVVFAPCGHYCCCASCANQMRAKGCPLCRQRIAQIVERDRIAL